MGAAGEILCSTNDWVLALLGEANSTGLLISSELIFLIITLSVRKLNEMCAVALCNFNFSF